MFVSEAEANALMSGSANWCPPNANRDNMVRLHVIPHPGISDGAEGLFISGWKASYPLM
jgi:hypothetical protein